MDFIKKSMLIGVGLATLTREKVEQAIDELIKKGEMSENDREGGENSNRHIEKVEHSYERGVFRTERKSRTDGKIRKE